MPPRRFRIVRVVDHHTLTAIPENSEQDANQVVELISPASYSVNVARRGLTSPSLLTFSTFSGVGEFTGRLARLTGESVLSLVDDTATLLRLRTIRRELGNRDKVPLVAQQLGRMMVDLKIIVEIKNSSSGIYRQCVELIKKVLMVPEIDQLQNGVNLFELCIAIYELDELEGLQKSIISLLRQCCGNASSLNNVGDDQGRIYSLTSLLLKIMRTPRRLCDVEILIDLLFILSSQSFTSYIKQENLQKELNSVVEELIDIIRDWMSKNFEDHRNCYLYAALTHIHDNPSSFYQISRNDSSCALGLNGIVKCGTENFKYPMFESPASFPMFEVFHDLRNALYECRGFSSDRVKTLFASRQSRELLLSNGLKEELLAFLPDIKGEVWRFGKIPGHHASLNAVDLLYILGDWDEVIDQHLKASDVHSMPYLEAAATTFIPLAADTIRVLLLEAQLSTRLQPQIAVLNGLSDDGQLTILPPYFRNILSEMRSSKTYRGVRNFHPQLAMSCLRLMNKRLQSNMLQLDDMFIQYDDMKSADLAVRVEHHIGNPLQYACQYWLYHVVEMNMNDYGMIEEDIHVFFFEERHLLHWIEVMSATKQVRQAQKCLLSFYNWTKGNEKIEQGLSKLVYECCHLLRCFNEPIVSGPLQIYVSAIACLPPDSLLHALYNKQAKLSPKVLFGHINDDRLFSPTLQPGPFVCYLRHLVAIAFSKNRSQIAFLSNASLEIWDSTTLSRINDPIELKHHPNYDGSVVFSPDGCKIAIHHIGSIEIWDLMERRLLVSQINNNVEAISFLDDTHLIYCRIQSNVMEISEWTISEDRTVTYTLPNSSTVATVTCVALSSEANYMGSILANKVMVWKLRSRSVIAAFASGDMNDAFTTMAFAHNEEHVACGSNKGIFKLWNFQTGSLVWTGKADSAIKQILMPLSLDNKGLVTVSKNGSVHVWDMTSGSCYKHESSAKVAALSPNGRHLVTSWNGVRVWAVEANKDEASFLPGEELVEVVFLTDGSLFAWVRGVKEGDIVILDKLGTANASRQILKGHASWIEELRFSSDGKRLVSRDRDDNIILWSRDGHNVRFRLREKHKFDREDTFLRDAVPLLNGGVLVAGSKEFEECIVTFDRNEAYLSDAVPLPNRGILVASSKEVVVWDNFGLQNEQKQVLPCKGEVCAVRLTSDGRGLVSCDDGDNVFLWCRGSDDVSFELRGKRACSGYCKCGECLEQLAYWQCKDTLEDLQNPASQTQADGNKDNTGEELKRGPFFTFDAKKRWVRLVDGRKLWHIPEVFLGYTMYGLQVGWCKSTQKGRKIAVYGLRFAILFEYRDDLERTLLK